MQFKIGETRRKPYGCNCPFTLDGMVKALSKAHKVSDALKTIPSEQQFWEWYDREIKEIGKETNIGTTIKTGERLARPMIPPKYPNLYFDWDLQNPKLPTNEPKKSSSYKVIQGFHCRAARDCLIQWDAPFTQTHADRHLGNLLGLQAGIPIEIRAQSMGHTVAMNENTYKKRQGIQTQRAITKLTTTTNK
ncbi:MAG: hypothetical protein QNJ65_08580 [Xenococcaceae cyanobacterium MO_234.B1]|nr:hypothetical protein [Xenococcaceae cyanobacterium MO_234.B1]